MTLSERNRAVGGLLEKLELHGPGERAHAERVAVFSVATGYQIGLQGDDLLHLRYAATLHDVGKVRVDSSLLIKLGTLTDDELRSMHQHAELSLDMLDGLDWLGPCLPMIIHHHERWDGQGYPTGLAANMIPLGARIIAVAETFDVMVYSPFWKTPMDEAEALDELVRCSLKQFDPQVVSAFLRVQPLIQPVEA